MMASASLMSLALFGKTLEQVQKIAEQFHLLVTTEAILDDESLGDLAAFASVKDMPSRIKCAMLPWRAMKSALHFEQSGN
jgi:nitrogen fixation protein NifU and related proteins